MQVATRFDIKQRVKIKEIARIGVILSIIIETSGVAYNVIHFGEDGTRYTDAMFEFELEEIDANETKAISLHPERS